MFSNFPTMTNRSNMAILKTHHKIRTKHTTQRFYRLAFASKISFVCSNSKGITLAFLILFQGIAPIDADIDPESGRFNYSDDLGDIDLALGQIALYLQEQDLRDGSAYVSSDIKSGIVGYQLRYFDDGNRLVDSKDWFSVRRYRIPSEPDSTKPLGYYKRDRAYDDGSLPSHIVLGIDLDYVFSPIERGSRQLNEGEMLQEIRQRIGFVFSATLEYTDLNGYRFRDLADQVALRQRTYAAPTKFPMVIPDSVKSTSNSSNAPAGKIDASSFPAKSSNVCARNIKIPTANPIPTHFPTNLLIHSYPISSRSSHQINHQPEAHHCNLPHNNTINGYACSVVQCQTTKF
jgi:hypothetical protein